MNLNYRVLLYLFRNKWKSILTIILFLVLNILLLSADIVGRSLENTINTFIQKAQPKIFIHYELLENIGDAKIWSDEKRQHREIYYEFIDKLNLLKKNNSVKNVSYSVYKYCFSDNLSTNDKHDLDMEELVLYGVDEPLFYDVVNYGINIVEGRNISSEEIKSAKNVCIVSDKLRLYGKELNIGDMIPIDICCFITENGYPSYSSDGIVDKNTFYLEVVGVFHGNLGMFDYDAAKSQYDNNIYCPRKIVEKYQSVNEEQIEGNVQITIAGEANNLYYPGIRDISVELADYQSTGTVRLYINELFGEYNRSIYNLDSQGEPKHNYYYCIAEEELYQKTALTIHMLENATANIGKVTFCVYMVMALIEMIILLKIRQKEIGIYISLGNRKQDVIKQFIMEVGTINVISGVVAIMLVSSLINPMNKYLLNRIISVETTTYTTDDEGNNISKNALVDLNKIVQSERIDLDKTNIISIIFTDLVITVMAGTLCVQHIVREKPRKIMLDGD